LAISATSGVALRLALPHVTTHDRDARNTLWRFHHGIGSLLTDNNKYRKNPFPFKNKYLTPSFQTVTEQTTAKVKMKCG